MLLGKWLISWIVLWFHSISNILYPFQIFLLTIDRLFAAMMIVEREKGNFEGKGKCGKSGIPIFLDDFKNTYNGYF